MKRLFLLSLGVVLIVGCCSAAPALKTPEKGMPAPAAKNTAPVKEAEKEGTIEAFPIKRANGTWLGVAVTGGNLTLSFYNEKKKPVSPDAARASARWNPSTKSGSMFLVMNPSADGKLLVGNKAVQPPYNFRLILTLLTADGTAIESLSVPFRQ